MTNYGNFNDRCPLCDQMLDEIVLDVSDHTDTYLEHLNKDYQLGVKNTRFYYQCGSCECLVRSMKLTQETMAELYHHFRDEALRQETLDQYFLRITSPQPLRKRRKAKLFITLNSRNRFLTGRRLWSWCFFKEFFQSLSKLGSHRGGANHWRNGIR